MQEHQVEKLTVDQVLDKFDGRKRFKKYVELLLEENTKINLVSRETSPEDLYRLVADCLVPAYLSGVKDAFSDRKWIKILDIGSGGGLPAIPLALALENAELTLIERTGKKAMFLRRALRALGIKGQVLNCNFREFADNPGILTATGELQISSNPSLSKPKFDFVTVRWVKADFAMIRRATGYLSEKDKRNGLLYYSPAEELQKLEIGSLMVASYPYSFSGDSQENRTLTVFRHK